MVDLVAGASRDNSRPTPTGDRDNSVSNLAACTLETP